MQSIKVHSKTRAPKEDQQAGPKIRLTAFPKLFKEHWNNDESTRSVEICAKQFVKEGMPRERLLGFMRMVFGWGGSRNVGNNFMNLNEGNIIFVRKQFLESHKYLTKGDDKGAIESLTAIDGLGVSYASKHLKFLNPNKAVVLDSLIARGLGYKLTEAGYVEFVGECRKWRDLLNQKKIKCCRTPQGRWRVSDVEMAVFIHVRKTAPKPDNNTAENE